MSDLISREAAIEMLDRLNCCGWVESAWEDVLHAIERVPYAQPEKRTEERTETHACDCISRRAALDCVSNSLVAWEAYEAIEALPSAQPEIIRCKDCKYWGKHELCDKWDYYISNGDFYCGCAERRTDENNNE